MTDRDKIIETMRDAILEADFESDTSKVIAERIFAHLQASGMAVVQGWQSIESAPKDGTEVLVCCPVEWNGRYSGDQIVVAENNGSTYDHGWRLTYTGGYAEDADLDGEPTHWMPLPASPSFNPVVQEDPDHG